jgi:OPA family glycerol-3-phosphate transporter-like MFS transporter/OPA family sugar phosphate sensor protein UhpC-like MFS transporter
MSSSSLTPETAKKFKYWQLRTMLVTWAAYAVFYVMRFVISVAMPGLGADLGITKVELGTFLTLHGLIYGLSRFINGLTVHKFMAGRFIACSLILCAITNLIFGLSSTVIVMGVMWLFHGWFQGMSWPAISRLLSYWIAPNELATKTSIWNTSHCVGTIAIFVTSTYLASLSFGWSGWRNIFFIPAALATVTAIVVWLLIKDTPSSVGLPELSVGENYKKSKDKKEESAEYKSFIKKQVFKNPYIWILAVSNLFVYVLRFMVLNWGPYMLKEWRGVSLSQAGLITAAFEAIGIVGIVLCGWVTDKYFEGKGHRVCAISMALSSLFMFLFWYTIKSPLWVSIATLVAAGFFINAAQSLVLIVASNMATKRAASAANGFVGIWGYGSSIITGTVFGYLVTKFDWRFSVGCVILLSVIGAILLFFSWNAKATGYEELEFESKKVKIKA